MEDCQQAGQFCQFYQDFFSLLEQLNTEWWAEKLRESQGSSDGEGMYNSVTGQYEQQSSVPEYLTLKAMQTVISQIISSEDFFVSTSTSLHQKLIEELTTFDFDSHFSHLNTSDYDQDDYDYYDYYYGARRRKRQAGITETTANSVNTDSTTNSLNIGTTTNSVNTDSTTNSLNIGTTTNSVNTTPQQIH